MNLKQVLAKVAKDQVPIFTKAGKVASVDTTNLTCEVTFDHYPTLYDVRLRSTIDGNEKGLIIIPKQGSDVIVGMIENTPTSAFIMQYSEVKEIRLGDNQFGGLVKIEPLVEQMNAIEDKLNSLITSYNMHIHPLTTGTSSPTATQETALAGTTQKSQLENPNVLH